jgi:tetratricopeptide (TPR) repeat protein
MQAVALQRAGKFSAAQALCGQVLSVDPRNEIALHLLGVLSTQLGQYESALRSLDLAIQYSSSPNAAMYSNRGLALQRSQNLMAAIEDFDRAISIQPNHAEAHSNRGSAMLALGLLDAAAQSFEQAIAIRPDFVLAHLNLARTLRELGRPDAAARSFGSVLTIQPDLLEALDELGEVLIELELVLEAVTVLKHAVKLAPDSPKLVNDLGVALHLSHQLDEAARWFAKAIALADELPEPHQNLGVVLSQQFKFDQALKQFDLAIARRLDYFEAFNHRAVALQAMGDLSASLADYARAIAINPDDAQIRLHQAMALLMTGDYRNGWLAYEWRWRTSNAKIRQRVFFQPLWLGAEPLGNRTILLHAEQGLGDTLQFSRYVPLLVERGARVLLEVPASLLQLMQDSFQGLSQYSAQDAAAPTSAAVEIVAAGSPLPDFDCHCPLMSLPLAFATDLPTIPHSHPYLVADQDRAQAWARRLGPRQRLRVGLVWSGGARPDQPELHLINERRNLPLNKLEPLRAIAADFYSLQKGEPAVGEFKRQLADGWNGPAMIDLTDELSDFAETAALIANLDLVISVDTSTAHLAAAIGKPVWILNRFDTCWRWLLDRRDSPWYPTVTLYRQTQPGVWDDVIEQVRKDLGAAVLKYEMEGIEAIDWGPPPSAKAPSQTESRLG